MPSRAEIRGSAENALRAVSIVLLAWLLWLSLERGRPDSVVSARSASLGSAVKDWSTSGIAPDRIAVQLDSTPSPMARDWLAALRGAGSEVSWSGNLPAVAISIQRVASPRGGLTVFAAAPGASTIRLSDEVGPLDTADARSGGARFSIPAATGVIEARSGGSRAEAAVPDSIRIRRVLVLGNAGWEAKFVIGALEEDGWDVDASMHVAPGVSVTQGSIAPIDTSRYSVVIALDASAASRASDIARYVATGGGLIISGAAASIDDFASVRAGTPGRVEAPMALALEAGSTTLRSLAVVPVVGLKNDAIVLDRRGDVAVAAARRFVGGRVLQQGYLETWRWRMSGGEESVEEHRSWWTRAVASVAHARRGGVRQADYQSAAMSAASPDDAPIARLTAALGAATPHSAPGLASLATSISLWWLFAFLSFCLLAEWWSRRLRGIR